MSLRFLNCGTMHPYFPPVENGITCLLVETNQGLVLVDTGFGTADYLAPSKLMWVFRAALRSPQDPDQTALHQVQRLGFKPEEVTHILITHLHLDHTGGLPDFPHARVHLHHRELDHIQSGRPGWPFRKEHWTHGPDWKPHRWKGGYWYDFEGIQLEGFEPEIWLVPLAGHTPGHAGVAVRQGDGWVLHGGDAVPFNVAVNEVPDWISRLVIGPHVPRIREFMKLHPEVQVVGAHMSLDFYDKI